MTTLGGGAPLALSATHDERNPIVRVADADAGVVDAVIVVDDRGFVHDGAPAAAALSE